MFHPDFAHLPFNRAALGDALRLAPPEAGRADGPGYWLLLRGDDLLTAHRGDRPELPLGILPTSIPYEVAPVCIGTWLGRPLLAARLAANAPAPPDLAPENAGIRRSNLDARLLSLAGLARQILHWRDRSRICPACGGPPRGIAGTYGVRCAACGREYFPRLHPAIIVLVRRGRDFLLVRKAYWPKGQYGLVAGYVEFAESLEECVIREVREETGILVAEPRYLCSQNWPYPSQIMAGFEASYAGGDIVVDTSELEHAAWFSPDRLPPALSPPCSTARYIIDTYALGK
jgi:NAD+ diphosphatase